MKGQFLAKGTWHIWYERRVREEEIEMWTGFRRKRPQMTGSRVWRQWIFLKKKSENDQLKG